MHRMFSELGAGGLLLLGLRLRLLTFLGRLVFSGVLVDLDFRRIGVSGLRFKKLESKVSKEFLGENDFDL
jgi:hypothetical protein